MGYVLKNMNVKKLQVSCLYEYLLSDHPVNDYLLKALAFILAFLCDELRNLVRTEHLN